MNNFKEFVDKKGRQAKKELEILKKVLESKGIKVKDFLDEDDPYIFVNSPKETLSFDGVRVYKIGNDLAFRVQKEESTHPYGKAYPLNVEEMYDDLVSDQKDEQSAGKEVIDAIVEEIKSFFEKSEKAERELRNSEFEKGKDPLSQAMVRSTGGSDYTNLIYNKTT